MIDPQSELILELRMILKKIEEQYLHEKCELIDEQIEELKESLHDKFMNNPQSIKDLLPEHILESIYEKFPGLFIKGFIKGNLEKSFKILWYQFIRKDNKLLMQFFGRNINEDVIPLGKLLSEFILPSTKIQLIKSLCTDVNEIQRECKEISEKISTIQAESDKILKSIECLKESSYTTGVNIDSLNTIQERITSEIADLNNMLKEKSIKKQTYLEIFKDVKKHINPNADDRDMVCGVCLEAPKTHVLGCGHIFCEQCINRLKGPRHITCPICKKTTSTVIKVFF